jgi:hypothetical protein
MKKPIKTYIVRGIVRHFTGDCKIYIVGVRREKAEAKKLGVQWVVDKQEEYKYAGPDYQTSYEIITTCLK